MIGDTAEGLEAGHVVHALPYQADDVARQEPALAELRRKAHHAVHLLGIVEDVGERTKIAEARGKVVDLLLPTPYQTIDTLHQCDAKGKDQVFIIYHNKKGAAVESTTLGFGGPLKVLVGFNAEGTILGYTILEHQETPGIGAKADQWFQEGQNGCIIGMTPADSLYVKKDGGQVDAITASTITSRAFLLAVNNAYKAYLGLKN